ncbi:MAG: archease, partial [Gammaproteobacteria bacterium]
MNTNTVCHWEHFSHDADIGIRGYGDTIESAFAQAAIAMTAVICEVDTV